MIGCLYKIDFPNGKSYIGITSQALSARMQGHRSKSNDSIVSRAIKKYGDRAIARKLVVAGDWEYLCELERRAIIAFGTKHPIGYNMKDGGEGQLNPAQEVREKMSRAAKARVVSAETRARHSLAMKGRVYAKATREKMSLAASNREITLAVVEGRKKMAITKTGKPSTLSSAQRLARAQAMRGNTHAVGYRHTDEAKSKIAAAGVGRSISEDGRARISAARKGKPLSAEHCAKLSASHVGKVSGNKGVKWSEETRAKHAARHAARKVKP